MTDNGKKVFQFLVANFGAPATYQEIGDAVGLKPIGVAGCLKGAAGRGEVAETFKQGWKNEKPIAIRYVALTDFGLDKYGSL